MINVRAKCPMGCGEMIFVGEGGHLTCSYVDCPDPAAIDRLVCGEDATADSLVRALTERCVCEHGRWAHADRSGRCFATGCPCQAFVPSGESPIAPEGVQLANRFIEGAQLLEQAGEGKGEKARRRAQKLADGMRVQALTVAFGLEVPRG